MVDLIEILFKIVILHPKITSLKRIQQGLDMFFCDNQPVAKQFAIGQKLGVNGTPSIFLSDGSFFPGYLSPEDLLKELKS